MIIQIGESKNDEINVNTMEGIVDEMVIRLFNDIIKIVMMLECGIDI